MPNNNSYLLTKNITLCLITHFLVFFAIAANSILFPKILKSHDFSEFFIGLSVSSQLIAGLFLAPILPKFSQKYSLKTLISLSLTILFFFSIIAPLFYSYSLWLIEMIILGGSIFAYLVFSGVVITKELNPKKREFTIALISLSMSFGISAGSFFISCFTNIDLLFLLSPIAIIISLIPILLLTLPNIHNNSPKSPSISSIKHGLFYFLSKKPEVFLGKFVQEFTTTTFLTFGAVYAINQGLNLKQSALIVTAFGISAFLNIIIAMISQKFDRIFIIKISVILVAISSTLFYLLSTSFLWAIFLSFLIGALAIFIFIAAASELISSFTDESLLPALSYYGFIANIAGISAGICVGTFLEAFGNIGLAVIFIMLALFFFSASSLIKQRS